MREMRGWECELIGFGCWRVTHHSRQDTHAKLPQRSDTLHNESWMRLEFIARRGLGCATEVCFMELCFMELCSLRTATGNVRCLPYSGCLPYYECLPHVAACSNETSRPE